MRMPKPPDSKKVNNFQHASRNYLKQNVLKIGDFCRGESVLGAGVRAFKSLRPDKQSRFGHAPESESDYGEPEKRGSAEAEPALIQVVSRYHGEPGISPYLPCIPNSWAII